MGQDHDLEDDHRVLIKVEDGCQTFKSYEFMTYSYNRWYPQPTIHTLTASIPLATPLPDQFFLNSTQSDHQNHRNPNQDHWTSTLTSSSDRKQKRSHSSNPSSPPYPWYDVIAVEHLTSIGPLCPTSTPKLGIDSNPTTKTDPIKISTDLTHDSNSNQDPTHSSNGHVNVHIAIIAGAIATCAIVIILTSLATLTICFRRRLRFKSDQDGLEGLRDHLDETSTTLSSIASDQGKERLENSNDDHHHHPHSLSPSWMIIPSPVSKSNSTIQHTNETTIETLSVNDQEDYESNQFNGNRKIKLMNRPHEFHQTHESNETLRSKSPSISISISDESNSPSYFIGDEIKFNKLKDLSTSNLTSTSTSNLKHSNSLQSALSCVATIASESVISSNPPIKEDLNQKEDDSSDHHQLTHNLTSLIEHKTFLWEMMSRSDDLKTSSNQIKSLDSLDELNLDETHESVYWKSRKSSS